MKTASTEVHTRRLQPKSNYGGGTYSGGGYHYGGGAYYGGGGGYYGGGFHPGSFLAGYASGVYSSQY
jgi:hypothetical protein